MAGVFISYRRDDSGGYAGRLYDALVAHFGRDLIFVDIDSIRAGENFVDVIDKRIAACSVVAVLIGKSWLKSLDDQGNRRLDEVGRGKSQERKAAFSHSHNHYFCRFHQRRRLVSAFEPHLAGRVGGDDRSDMLASD